MCVCVGGWGDSETEKDTEREKDSKRNMQRVRSGGMERDGKLID